MGGSAALLECKRATRLAAPRNIDKQEGDPMGRLYRFSLLHHVVDSDIDQQEGDPVGRPYGFLLIPSCRRQ